MRYIILTGKSPDNLERSVMAHIASGYVPIGGVSVAHDKNESTYKYAQAMVFKTKNSKKEGSEDGE